jgi:hypothetical protein
VEINVWKHNHHTRIYGIYSPPNNKCLNLDILDLTNNNIVIMGDFNTASPDWSYTYKNATGKAVEEFLVANTAQLLYNPKDPPAYLHYSGHATNPDLSIVSTNLANLSTRILTGDMGSDHRAVITRTTRKHTNIPAQSRTTWNFKRANWEKYKIETEENVKQLNAKGKPEGELRNLTNIIMRSAKNNVPGGKVKNYKPF